MVRTGVLWGSLALGAMALVATAACSGESFPETVPVPPPACVDTDGDGFLPAHCGGDDCNDADPYINPGQLDEGWGFETRYVERGDRIRSFTIDAQGTAHWLIRRSDDDEPARNTTRQFFWSSLMRAEGPDLSFGTPVTFYEGGTQDYVTQLRNDEEGTHVIFRSMSGGTLRFMSSANDWQIEEPLLDVTGPLAPLLRYQGALALAFERNFGGELLWATQNTDGTWSSTSILVEGHLHGAALSALGEPHVLASDASGCFIDGQLNADDSWTWTTFDAGQTCQVMAVTQDPQGHMYVLFNNLTAPPTTWLADNTSGQWQANPVDPETPGILYLSAFTNADMVVDATGTVHVLMAEDIPQTTEPLYYLKRDDSGWSIEMIAQQTSSKLALAPDGELVIALTRALPDLSFPQIAIVRRMDDGIDQDCSESLP